MAAKKKASKKSRKSSKKRPVKRCGHGFGPGAKKAAASVKRGGHAPHTAIREAKKEYDKAKAFVDKAKRASGYYSKGEALTKLRKRAA